jgi:MoaA/NifB/PqqE/SkfB family radical SAM enzyme
MRSNPELALKISPTRSVSIELASSCNIKCLCCPVGQGKIPKGVMTQQDFEKIVELIPKYVKQIDFSHRGDPTMNPGFPEMVNYAQKKGFVTDLYTNGLILDRYIERLVECGLTTLRVDLDGARKESYEKYRIGSNFQKVKDNVQKLVKARSRSKKKCPEKIYLISVVSSFNEDEIQEMQDMARALGVDGIMFKSAIINYGTKYYNDETVQNDMIPRNKKLWRPERKNGFTCPFLWRGSILYNGDFIMCTADFEGEYIVGNILRENSFKKVYFSHKAQKARERIMKRKGLCRSCAVVDENHYIKDISLQFTP